MCSLFCSLSNVTQLSSLQPSLVDILIVGTQTPGFHRHFNSCTLVLSLTKGYSSDLCPQRWLTHTDGCQSSLSQTALYSNANSTRHSINVRMGTTVHKWVHLYYGFRAATTTYCLLCSVVIVQQDGMMFSGRLAPGIQLQDGSFPHFSSSFVPTF